MCYSWLTRYRCNCEIRDWEACDLQYGVPPYTCYGIIQRRLKKVGTRCGACIELEALGKAHERKNNDHDKRNEDDNHQGPKRGNKYNVDGEAHRENKGPTTGKSKNSGQSDVTDDDLTCIPDEGITETIHDDITPTNNCLERMQRRFKFWDFIARPPSLSTSDEKTAKYQPIVKAGRVHRPGVIQMPSHVNVAHQIAHYDDLNTQSRAQTRPTTFDVHCPPISSRKAICKLAPLKDGPLDSEGLDEKQSAGAAQETEIPPVVKNLDSRRVTEIMKPADTGRRYSCPGLFPRSAFRIPPQVNNIDNKLDNSLSPSGALVDVLKNLVAFLDVKRIEMQSRQERITSKGLTESRERRQEQCKVQRDAIRTVRQQMVQVMSDLQDRTSEGI